jgi:tRNA (mo5U34)-methyltransferase
MLADEAQRFVASHSFWYHRMYLGDGQYSMPNPVHADIIWRRAKPAVPADLRGASVLDLGCNAGFFSTMMRFHGAGRIVGVEPWDIFVDQANVIKRVWGMDDIDYRLMDAHDIGQISETFNLVVFCGLLYHLENPFQVIRQIGRLCTDAVIVETEVIPEDPRNRVAVRLGDFGKVKLTTSAKGFMKFIEGTELNGDASNWWVPDTECVLAMLRVAGFKYFSKPVYPIEGRLLLIASKNQSSLLNLSHLK